jgi:thiol-disulfide isomerase/thioredoxin
MRRARFLIVNIALLVGAFATASSFSQAPAAVAVKVAKYQELCDLIEANKGKVVVVDFWALTCIPCKRAFPHTVKMQKDLGAKGLTVISVSTDSLEEDRDVIRGRVLKFLTNNNAAIPNMILDEPDSVLRGKLRISQLPCIYVFNRAGKWRQFIEKDLVFDANDHYPEFEAYVEACLREPAPK